MVASFKTYLLSTRPQFFTAVLVPIAVGAALATYEGYPLRTGLLILTILAGVLIHGGTNVINDYFDHLNTTDNINKNHLTPFTGGSRMIQTGKMTPHETFWLAIVLFTASALIGLYLAYITGPILLVLGGLGLFSGIFYSAPVGFFAGRGLGEFVVGLNFGLLTVAGAFYVQTGILAYSVVFAALPVSFLITALLYINQFPDFEADRDAGKRNIVVKLGRERARYFYPVILASAFVSLVIGVLLNYLPLALSRGAPARNHGLRVVKRAYARLRRRRKAHNTDKRRNHNAPPYRSAYSGVAPVLADQSAFMSLSAADQSGFIR